MTEEREQLRASVLVLGSERQTKLIGELSSVGLEPVVHEGLYDSVQAIKQEDIAGILVDTKYGDVDALEFILNARDISLDIPIVVMSRKLRKRDRSVLVNLPNTFVIHHTATVKETARQFSQIVWSGTLSTGVN
ncbi:MAG: hypothetical protein U9Q79_07695 [Candidatus Hydrogenedentes bacterium]|nr:hypothetical protein [Candidatus Hydrogenedentota bacterium]